MTTFQSDILGRTVTINITPTWAGVLPTLLVVFTDSTSNEDKAFALDELRRMARLADLYVASQKDPLVVMLDSPVP